MRLTLLLLLTVIFGNVMADCSCERWKGCYISGQFGHFWQRESDKFANKNYFNTLGSELLGNRFHFRYNQYRGGLTLGSNYQQGCFVMGYEAGAFFINHKKTIQSPFFPVTDTFSSTLNWLGNVKVRAGIAYHKFFAYLFGGWAGGSAEIRLQDHATNIIAKKRGWANGWIAGGGVEHKLFDNLSFGVEFNYIELENRKQKLTCPGRGNGVGLGSPKVSNRHQIQTVFLKLTFIFC